MVRPDEREKCVFSVLSVRAEVLVVPDLGDEDVRAVAELTEEMNVLSMTAEQQHTSSFVDHVGKAKSVLDFMDGASHHQASRANAAADATARLRLQSSGKNVIAQVSVVSEESKVVAHKASIVSSWLETSSKGIKQEVVIPSKTILLYVLNDLGVSDPLFTRVDFCGQFQVHIDADMKPLVSRIPSARNRRISGELCTGLEHAETSAIKKAFEHLEDMYNVAVVDLSTDKIRLLNIKLRDKFMHLDSSLSCVDQLLLQWSGCCDLFYEVKKIVHGNVSAGGGISEAVKGYDNMVACGLNKLCNALDGLSSSSLEEICSFRLQFKALENEKEKYQEDRRSKPYTGSKSFVVHGAFYEIDILAFLLDWMNFEQAVYATTTNDEGLYLGMVHLHIPRTQSITVASRIRVAAYCPEATLSEANNSAAREAVLYLEHEFKLEVVDYNFARKVKLEDELFFLNDLDRRVLLLGATVKEFWKMILNRFSDVVTMTKEDAKHTACKVELADKADFINYCMIELERTEREMSGMFGLAVEKLNDLTPVVYERV